MKLIEQNNLKEKRKISWIAVSLIFIFFVSIPGTVLAACPASVDGVKGELEKEIGRVAAEGELRLALIEMVKLKAEPLKLSEREISSSLESLSLDQIFQKFTEIRGAIEVNEFDKAREILITPRVPKEISNEVRDLIEKLKSDNYEGKISAAGALGRIGPEAKEAVPALAEALKSLSLDVRDYAVNALGKIGPEAKEAVPALTEALKDLDFKWDAVKALGKIGAPAVPALAEALKDPDSGVRISATDALGRIGAPAVPALTEALKDPDVIVRDYAAEALGKIGPEAKEAVPVLTEALKDPDLNVRISAAKTLGKIGSEAKEAVPALAETLKDSDVDVRFYAALSLGKIRDAKEAVPALTEALKDLDLGVRIRAADALGDIGPEAKEAIPALIEFMKEVPGREQKVMPVLIRIGEPAVPALIELFENPIHPKDSYNYESLQRDIALALGEIGDLRAIPFLVRASEDANELVRDDVASALGKYDPKLVLEASFEYFKEKYSEADAKRAMVDMINSNPEMLLGGQQLNEMLGIIKEKSLTEIRDSNLKYWLYYNGLVGEVTSQPAELFPHQERIRNLIGSGPKKVLVVQGIHDGQGDELIRMVPLVQGLIDLNPELEFTIYTDRPYLYSENEKITVKSIRDVHALSTEGFFDVIINHFDAHQKYVWGIDSLVSIIVDSSNPSIYIRTSKSSDNFVFEEVSVEGTSVNVPKDPTRHNVYDAVSKLSAEFGLPLRAGTQNPKGYNLILGEGDLLAERWWKENVVMKNNEGRPVIGFNGFGGEALEKGYSNPKEMAEDISALVDVGNFVVIFTNDQKWGTYDKSKEIFDGLSPKQQRSVVIAPQPSEAGTSIKHWVAKSDNILTVEGGMMHLAYNLGRPFTVILKSAAGSPKWIPALRGEDQGVVGVAGRSGDLTADIRRVGTVERVVAEERGAMINPAEWILEGGKFIGKAAVAPFVLAYRGIRGIFVKEDAVEESPIQKRLSEERPSAEKAIARLEISKETLDQLVPRIENYRDKVLKESEGKLSTPPTKAEANFIETTIKEELPLELYRGIALSPKNIIDLLNSLSQSGLLSKAATRQLSIERFSSKQLESEIRSHQEIGSIFFHSFSIDKEVANFFSAQRSTPNLEYLPVVITVTSKGLEKKMDSRYLSQTKYWPGLGRDQIISEH